MIDRIKRTNVTGLLLLVIMAMACWAAVQPGIIAEDQSSYTLFGQTPREIKHFNVTTTTTGDNEVIAGVTDKTFLILACSVFSTDESTAKVAFYMHSGAQAVAGSATGKFPIDKTGISGYAGWVMGANTYGWLSTTTTGEALTINLDGDQTVNVIGTYIEL
ncbi:MAG: hypothetical protein WC455_26480 [Dehalococcoidia bacterium]|jgi:hypothetical protein